MELRLWELPVLLRGFLEMLCFLGTLQKRSWGGDAAPRPCWEQGACAEFRAAWGGCAPS